MVTFTINIPPMLAYIPHMDPMGIGTTWKQIRNLGDGHAVLKLTE